MEIQVFSEYKVERNKIQLLFQLLSYKKFGEKLSSTGRILKVFLVSSETIKA